MKELLYSKRYWLIGTIVSLFGVLVAKLPYLIGTPENKYYQSAGYIIALLGLFFIAIKIKKK